MKQLKLFVLIVLCGTMFTSCRFHSLVTRAVPTAINTVNTVRLSELNLERKDYTILKNVTAEAVILYREIGNSTYMEEENGDFSMHFEFDEDTGWKLKKHTGIARFGFLSNDYDPISFPAENPGYVARNLAIYRVINFCKVQGGDGLIEPVISMSVEERSDGRVAFKTVVTAKLLKLKTDK